MKTIIINPNQIREGVANFRIEYRFKKIPFINGGPACQRFFRLTEIPILKVDHIKPEKTVWHEIYSEDLSAVSCFKKRLKTIGSRFQWNGKLRDLCKLISLLSAAGARS